MLLSCSATGRALSLVLRPGSRSILRRTLISPGVVASREEDALRALEGVTSEYLSETAAALAKVGAACGARLLGGAGGWGPLSCSMFASALLRSWTPPPP